MRGALCGALVCVLSVFLVCVCEVGMSVIANTLKREPLDLTSCLSFMCCTRSPASFKSEGIEQRIILYKSLPQTVYGLHSSYKYLV